MAGLFLRSRGVLEPGRRWLFGFLIDSPIALYYMQGLNITAVHAHAALFGVYGNLGLGLTLLSLRLLTVRTQWRTRSL